jgi:membrane protein implicated in regulation of membrane protease activity
MPLELLLAWWNLIYILPFVLALIYLGLFVFTGVTFGDADADMDADAQLHVEAHVPDMDSDAGLGMGHDVNAEHDVGADHDADGDAGHGSALMPRSGASAAILAHPAGSGEYADAGAHASVLQGFFSLLGLGKIPLSLALMIFMLSWGVAGFAINAVMSGWMGPTALVALISLPVALVISLTITGLCAAAVGKVIPADGGTPQRRQDLVGKRGEAIYDINATFGMANVRGDAGDLFQVPCRTGAGRPPIPKGARVVLCDYDRDKGVFQAAPFEA